MHPWVGQQRPLAGTVAVVTGTKEPPLNNVSLVPLIITTTLYRHTLLAGTFNICPHLLLYTHTSARPGLHRSGARGGEDFCLTECEPRDHLHHHGGVRGHDGLLPLDCTQFW